MRDYVTKVVLAGLLAAFSLLPSGPVSGQAAPAAMQSTLGPGLYVFQTRTRHSLCGDSEKDGYVMSFFAAIDGVPGSVKMAMQLVNTQHFVKWNLEMGADGVLKGMSRIGDSPTAPMSEFSVTRHDDRWKGTGSRNYQGKLNGQPARCRVDYDALLRRIDTRLIQEATE